MISQFRKTVKPSSYRIGSVVMLGLAIFGIFAVVLLVVSLGGKSAEQKLYESQPAPSPTPVTDNVVWSDKVKVITVDNCEYVLYTSTVPSAVCLVHKGNCKNHGTTEPERVIHIR